ncbi:MAG: DUF4352 domain-containing protein [Thermomicrobiales bacterium]
MKIAKGRLFSLTSDRGPTARGKLMSLLIPLLLIALAGSAAMAAGQSRNDPVPFKQEAQIGPWKMVITDVVTGDAAVQQVMAASDLNEAPADGSGYLLVKIKVTNSGQRTFAITPDDFAVTGTSGNVHRNVGVVVPDPALDGAVEPGASLEGWVVLGESNDEQQVLLLYDSLTIPGNWADGVLALQDGARVADAGKAAAKPNDAGKDPASPAALDTQIVTVDWAIQVTEVESGEAVYNLYPASDYRTTALTLAEATDEDPWLAFKVRVTNVHTGGKSAFLSPSAFQLADEEGNPIDDVLTLTPPAPDASGSYFPGASRDGWVVFEVPASYSGSLVRILPNLAGNDPRYFTWDGSAPSNEAQPKVTHVPLTDLAVGDRVVTNDQGVNLRKSASTDAAVVATYPQGTVLTVTGGSKEADGHTWYPVKNPDTGDKGWVASEFLDRAG